jgi:hypothetical protein
MYLLIYIGVVLRRDKIFYLFYSATAYKWNFKKKNKRTQASFLSNALEFAIII